MISVMQVERSRTGITIADLTRLANIAAQDRREYFQRHPERAALGRRILAVELCQGAALHFLDGTNGVKDFDVWTFYAAHPQITYPPRRITHRDFGVPKFGRSPDWGQFRGRRVDLLGRSIKVRAGEDRTSALRRYLTEGRTESAKQLAKKAVILLEPAERRGEIVWPAGEGNYHRARWDMPKSNVRRKTPFTPIRFFAKRRDAEVSTTERQIEKMLQLPAGRVKLVLPNGRKARADKTIEALLRDYGW